jgi:hypothetical protein
MPSPSSGGSGFDFLSGSGHYFGGLRGIAEVITGSEHRRRWSYEQKRAIVAASLEPGAVVAEVRGGRRSVRSEDPGPQGIFP